MDERLRRFEREGRGGGDTIMEIRVIRERLRAGTLSAERAELLAHIGHEPARIALGLGDAKPVLTEEENLAWWRVLAQAGREAGVRAAIALARPHLCESIWGHDRFAGVAEEAWQAVEALEEWVRSPGETRVTAFQAAVTQAVEAPHPAGGVGILVAISGLITASAYEEAIVHFGESMFHSRVQFDILVARMRRDLVPWALGEPDPIATRHLEEGRHFGADPDISRCVSFSRDGRFVVSSSFTGSVTVRDAVSGAIVRDFERGRGQVFAAAFSPDGTRVFAGGTWSNSRLLEVSSGRLVHEIPQLEVQDVAFVDDARVLAAGDKGELVLWDVATPKEVRRFEGHERMVTHVGVASGGRAVSASSDETIRVWDLETGAQVGLWKQPASIDSVALSPDGRHVALGCGRGQVRLLALDDGAEVRVFDGRSATVYGLAFTPDGSRLLAVMSADGTQIFEWSVSSAEVLRTWDYFHAVTFHIAVSPDGKRFLTGDREGGLREYVL
ncbi:MAG: WD40 repeat domain-containing protein [Planctomycetota bacterium]